MTLWTVMQFVYDAEATEGKQKAAIDINKPYHNILGLC